MPFNLPIFLTWLRVALVPLLVGIFYLPEHWISLYAQSLTAAIIFIVAAITDWIDGYLARKWNQTSAFGAFLDPVADKLIVAGSLLVLVQLGRVSAILGFIIIGREIAISALREWMAKIGAAASVKVNWFGKIKTIAQMTAIPMLLYFDPIFGLPIAWIGTVLIYIAAILTIYSMCVYMSAAWPHLQQHDQRRN